MQPQSEKPPQSLQGTAPAFLWAIVCIVLLFSSFAVGFSDDVAVLYPIHRNALLMWSVGIGFGFVSMAVGLYFFRNAPARWVLAVLLFLIGGDAAGSFTWCIAARVELARDFPPGQVHTSKQLVPILTVTRSVGGRGRVDRNVELQSGWPTVEVRAQDYSFMLHQRNLATNSAGRNRIVSNGYFCAIVTVEETSSAKRIVGLTSRKLPEDSVTFCPGATPST